MTFPSMFRIRQQLEGPRLADVDLAVRESIRKLQLGRRVRAGQTVAITAGSRGIANIDVIIRAVVQALKELQLQPLIVPAMGSHGGATAEGQRKVLEQYGIVEARMGCPIKSSMEVVEVGKVKGTRVFCDEHAWGADHIAVVGRIKCHPDIDGEIESGLFKMMAIGLGKRHGAEHYHRAGQEYGNAEIFPLVGSAILRSGHILFGLGIVENGYEETAKVQALLPHDFEAGEKALLKETNAWLARLPFEELDLLIVDEIGKNISGAGMDSIVIGRTTGQKVLKSPRIRRIIVRDLTPETEGNAVGIGAADMTTRRLVSKLDYGAMYVNAVTGGAPELVKVPMASDSDRDAIRAALGMIGLTPPERARVARIQNTLRLTELDVSESLLIEAQRNPRVTLLRAAPFAFDAEGNLGNF
jgi:hypothetical protein